MFGVNFSGLAWVVPLALSLLILTRNFGKVTFPFNLWIPWVLLLFSYLLLVESEALDPRVIPAQRTVQLLSPLLVGMAASTFRPNSLLLDAFFRGMRILSILLLGIVCIKTGVLFTGRLPDVTGLAAEVMTVMLLCCFFASRFLVGREKLDLTFWGMLTCVPVVSLTRTAIAATLLTFPLSFGPMRKSSRIFILLLIVGVGMGLFYSPRVQKKMFYSGQGELSDILNEDFATSGRSFMWEQMYARAQEEHWTGHGTGSGESFVYQITRKTGYPHNDWLLTYFDYGVLGIAIFACSMLLMIWHCLRQARIGCHQQTRLLLLTGASAFLPFMLLMMTDNIMVYASFFGNLHFTILGLAYGALRAERLSDSGGL